MDLPKELDTFTENGNSDRDNDQESGDRADENDHGHQSTRGCQGTRGHQRTRGCQKTRGRQSTHRYQSASESNSHGKDASKDTDLSPLAKSIEITDINFEEPLEFCPLCDPGPYLPSKTDVSALSLLELYFDNTAMNRIQRCTLAYAEDQKMSKPKQYKLFKRRPITVPELKAFLGALLLLGIHGIRNHRKAWSTANAQVLIRPQDLLTCQRFELIGSFLQQKKKRQQAVIDYESSLLS